MLYKKIQLADYTRFGVLIGGIWFDWGEFSFMIVISAWFYGAPGEIRTPDLVVRSHALYPTELRARIRTSQNKFSIQHHMY